MVNTLHPDTTESNPLSTELDTHAIALVAAEADAPESTFHSAVNQQTHPVEDTLHADDAAAFEDFAAALESFDREQAAEAAALAADDNIVTGTVVKLTDKHVVVDVGLKSEGLIPLAQVLDHTGQPSYSPAR